MISKLVGSFAIRSQAARRFAPLIKTTQFFPVAQRGFLDRIGLENQPSDLVVDPKKAEVSLWKEQVKAQENALVLKDRDQIEKYVISLVQNYFRTTKKQKVTLESSFRDHGLDSLDIIELVIQVEDELGYVIDAEKLQLFQKPKHFVNYISQMEAYKAEFHKLPHENIHAEFNWREAFPGLPGEKKKKAAH